MKKSILLIVLSVSTIILQAQNLYVTKKTRVNLGEPAYFATFGNSSDLILYTGENKQGLKAYNLRDKTKVVISDEPGAIQKAHFSNDGNIYFSTIEFQKGRRVNIEQSYNIKSGKVEKTNSVAIHEIEVKVSGKSIEIEKKGEDKYTIEPLDDLYYLWVSVSPDKSKILFTAGGKGTYICDLNGDNIVSLGYLNAPEWINNEWVTGMHDIDDGERIITSNIMAINIAIKKKYNLTNEDKSIALYPKVSSDGNKIVYHTAEGEVFILDLKIMN